MTQSPTSPRPEAAKRHVVAPKIDVVESDQALRMWVELPGVAPGDAHISLERGALTLEAAPRVPERAAGLRQIWGRPAEILFRRGLELGVAIDAGRVSARLEDGVLELVLPKAGHAARHRIEVRRD